LAVIPKTVDKSVDNYVDDSRDCLSNLYSYQIAQNMGNDKSNNINILQNNHRFLHLLKASAQIMPCKDAGRRIFYGIYEKRPPYAISVLLIYLQWKGCMGGLNA
jgi:hypothetical protein